MDIDSGGLTCEKVRSKRYSHLSIVYVAGVKAFGAHLVDARIGTNKGCMILERNSLLLVVHEGVLYVARGKYQLPLFIPSLIDDVVQSLLCIRLAAGRVLGTHGLRSVTILVYSRIFWFNYTSQRSVVTTLCDSGQSSASTHAFKHTDFSLLQLNIPFYVPSLKAENLVKEMTIWPSSTTPSARFTL
jgi:hypothetical protein